MTDPEEGNSIPSRQTCDDIAEEYRDSKLLPFRYANERYAVFQLLSAPCGKTVLDLACGEGIYARQFKRAGAASVMGVDVSREMIALTEVEPPVRDDFMARKPFAGVTASKP